MNISKKLGAAAASLAVLAAVAPSANAQTVQELMAQIQALQAQLTKLSGTTATVSSTTFTKDLTVGSKGEEVKALQVFLNANGSVVATSGAGSQGNETTYFGNATKAALAKYQAANGITPSSGYFGPKTRAFVNAKGTTTTTGTTTGTTTTTTAVAPLSIALATDTAASANVQKGSANNQVLKFTLTGAADKATTVTGLTLKSYGTTEATGTKDIAAVKLFDENGIQIGNDRTPAGNSVNFVIVPALTIPANGSRTITVTANVGSAANTMAVVRYGVESATAISGGTTFTGNYPVMGNSFTIVPAGQLGALTVGNFGSIPKTSVKTGESAVLAKFNVSAGSNEDIAINQIVVTRTGGSDSSVSNVTINNAGTSTVVAGPVSFVNKKATLNLATPISLVKGSSINLDVVGNISETTDGTSVTFSIADGGVVAKGATSGTNITSTGSATANTISIGNEKVTVSMSSAHPQGTSAYIVQTNNKKDIAKFDVKSTGGDVILSSVVLGFTNLTTTNYLSNVGIYDGDSLISDLQAATGASNTFALNYTLPAGTTKTLTVKAVTLHAPGSTAVTWTSASGSGLASGNTIATSAGVSTTAVSFFAAGSVTNSSDTTKTPYNQAILAPSNDVTVAAIKGYAQLEDMKLNTLKLSVVAPTTGANQISSIRLFADDGVTALTDVISPDSGASATLETFTVDSSSIISDIIFSKGVNKTILVKANVNGTGTAAGVYFNIVSTGAHESTFIGQDSGASTDAAALNLAIATPYNGGTFSSTTKVVTLQKNSGTPSGTIGRGSQTTVGIWDVNNYDSTLASATITAITLTSKTGLGSVAGTDTGLFKLYDENGNLVGTSTTVTPASNTVAFTGLTYTVLAGSPRQLKLVVDTTSTAKFASNAQLQFSIENVGDVTVTTGSVGYAAGVWTIPAPVNTVQLP